MLNFTKLKSIKVKPLTSKSSINICREVKISKQLSARIA